MDAEKRDGSQKYCLDRQRQDDRSLFSKGFLPPCRQQEQTRRQGEEESPLGDKQSEKEVLPFAEGIRIRTPTGLEKKESRAPAVEKKRRQSDAPPPSAKVSIL